jgi:hypothetical protein
VGSTYHEYASLSADEEKKRCGLIACPALRDRPRQHALRAARTNLTAPSRGRKDAHLYATAFEELTSGELVSLNHLEIQIILC